jgi:CheY-like chemotaxis protein
MPSVLIVDDSEVVRVGVRRLLEGAGYTCSEVASGAEALEQASNLKLDLIVLDFSMPGMSGLEVAPLLHTLHPKTPIILFTMFASEKIANVAQIAGIRGVVSKDRAVQDLLQKAKELTKFI